MIRVALGIAIMAVGIVLIAFGAPTLQSDDAEGKTPLPHKRIGDIDRERFPEPSGITYHPGRKTLFVVGDEGDICEIRTDGTPVKRKMHEVWRDYEGITCNPATGLLYVVVEGEEVVLEVDPETLATKREFAIERTFKGRTVMKAGGDGIEDIAFRPDEKHAEGGTFYVAHQSFTLKNPEEASAVFEVELPLKTGAAGGESKGKILRQWSLGVVDLAGLCFDRERQRLYVLSDAANLLMEVSTEGKVLRRYGFPGQNQEGIAVDPEDYIYFTQDSGGIIKLKWLREEKKEQ